MAPPAGTPQPEPLRSAVDASEGWLLLEFGATWCGYCQAAKPAVQAFVQGHALDHLWVEDGKGRPLGRSFAVKLWPTLILLRDGQELARVVRPLREQDLAPLQNAMTV